MAVCLGLLAFLGVACGDDDDEAGNGSASPTASRSPSATGADETPEASPDETEQPSLTPAPESTTAAAPTPRPPVLEPGVAKIGEGTMTFSLLPEGEYRIDPLALIQPGTATPPCAAFVFAFSWQITDPFPPGSNQIVWRITQQDVTQDVGQGASGTATVGCGQLIALNDGPDTINVSVWYKQGEIQS